MANRRRVAAVQVIGATTTNGIPVAIVRLGEAGLAESTTTICRQATGWLG